MQDKIVFILANLVIILFVFLNSICLLKLLTWIQGDRFEDNKYIDLLKTIIAAFLNMLLLYPELHGLGFIFKIIK
jgi:hypothetical protein